MIRIKIVLLFFSFLIGSKVGIANDITVSNVSLTGRVIAGTNSSTNYTMVKFDLSWANSWRTSSAPNNWDAAWVFVKFRVGASDPTFSNASSSGSTVTVSSTAGLRVGMPVRITGGTGSFNFSQTGASSASNVVTVSSTTNLRVGMKVVVTAGTGAFRSNTVIKEINSSTTFTVASDRYIPITLSNATITFYGVPVITSIPSATTFVLSETPTTPLSNASITCTRVWEHARLNDIGHSAGIVAGVDAGTISTTAGLLTTSTSFNAQTNPCLGVFFARTASSTAGTVTCTNAQLRWNYGAGSSSDSRIIPDDESVEVKVFAIEMVYIPQGSFYIGSGAASFESNSFYKYPNTTDAYQISSEAAITVGTGTGNLYYNSGGGDQVGPIPANFPKGFNSFYCMKYEISNGQYRDFLNTLSYVQQVQRMEIDPAAPVNTPVMQVIGQSAGRNTVVIQTEGNPDNNLPAVIGCNYATPGVFNGVDDGQWIACNFLNFNDAAAFADWSGLRPMTELEFEKACRGGLSPVSYEYAWGNSSYTSAANFGNITFLNIGTSNETSNVSSANVNVASNTATRVGMFATSTTTREQSGASYYGVMDLSGNLSELVVNVGESVARAFSGQHGDGSLTRRGNSDISTWPQYTSSEGEITGGTGGAAWRGGSYKFDNTLLRVSNRIYGFIGPNNSTQDHSGFRAVRTSN